MVIPLVLPIFYSLKYKKESLVEILLITLSMILIVIGYWPLTIGFNTSANLITKFILFILIPLITLYIYWKIRNKGDNKEYSFEQFGITNKGIESSFKLGLILIPAMLIVTFIVKSFMTNISIEPNFPLGVVSFVESFTEEFFFRGILFLFLIGYTNFKIAYITSLASFILMHPQNFTNPFILSTITQGVLTLEICRRTKNLAGAWVLHGSNRFFSIVILPLLL